MSFTFGFSGEDYSSADDEQSHKGEEKEGEEAADDTELATSTSNLNISQSVESTATTHSLSELLCWLPESIAYGFIHLSPTLKIARREVWDVKHQLMSGFSSYSSSTSPPPLVAEDEEQVLEYLGSDDLIRGVYEGGFKTWECSIDLSRHLSTLSLPQEDEKLRIVEVGCGSAIPSATLLSRFLSTHDATGEGIELVVQDFNVSVLRFLTLPNLFLAWYFSSSHPSSFSSSSSSSSSAVPVPSSEDGLELELKITESLKQDFITSLTAKNIQISVISGPWSRQMSSLISSTALNISSETIYSPSSLPQFCALLQATLKQDGIGLIAAKKVYFGVGGGIEEFKQIMQGLGMDSSSIEEQSDGRDGEGSDDGIKRTILKVRHRL